MLRAEKTSRNCQWHRHQHVRRETRVTSLWSNVEYTSHSSCCCCCGSRSSRRLLLDDPDAVRSALPSSTSTTASHPPPADITPALKPLLRCHGSRVAVAAALARLPHRCRWHRRHQSRYLSFSFSCRWCSLAAVDCGVVDSTGLSFGERPLGVVWFRRGQWQNYMCS